MLHIQRDLVDVNNLRILGLEDYPGLLGWLQCNHLGPYMEGGRRVGVREEMTWQQKQRSRPFGARAKECWKPLEAEKGQEIGSPQSLQKEQPWGLGFWPPALKERPACCRTVSSGHVKENLLHINGSMIRHAFESKTYSLRCVRFHIIWCQHGRGKVFYLGDIIWRCVIHLWIIVPRMWITFSDNIPGGCIIFWVLYKSSYIGSDDACYCHFISSHPES